jgi:hypothetical protein
MRKPWNVSREYLVTEGWGAIICEWVPRSLQLSDEGIARPSQMGLVRVR